MILLGIMLSLILPRVYCKFHIKMPSSASKEVTIVNCILCREEPRKEKERNEGLLYSDFHREREN